MNRYTNYYSSYVGRPEQGTMEEREANAVFNPKMVQNSSLVLVCDSFGKNKLLQQFCLNVI